MTFNKQKFMEVFPRVTVREDMENGMMRHQQFEVVDIVNLNDEMHFKVKADWCDHPYIPAWNVKERNLMAKWLRKQA